LLFKDYPSIINRTNQDVMMLGADLG